MVLHRDRRTTKSVTRTPLRPPGYRGIGPSATFPLLDRCGASTSSRRLAYVPMALVTRSLQGPAMMRWTPPDDLIGIDVPESSDMKAT